MIEKADPGEVWLKLSESEDLDEPLLYNTTFPKNLQLKTVVDQIVITIYSQIHLGPSRYQINKSLPV